MSMRENKETTLDLPFLSTVERMPALTPPIIMCRLRERLAAFHYSTTHTTPHIYFFAGKHQGFGLKCKQVSHFRCIVSLQSELKKKLPDLDWTLTYVLILIAPSRQPPSLGVSAAQKISNQWLCHFSFPLEAILDQKFSPIFSIN